MQGIKLGNNYKDGRTLKEFFCSQCNKKISKTSGLYGSGKCAHCSQTCKVLTKEHEEKVIKNFKSSEEI